MPLYSNQRDRTERSRILRQGMEAGGLSQADKGAAVLPSQGGGAVSAMPSGDVSKMAGSGTDPATETMEDKKGDFEFQEELRERAEFALEQKDKRLQLRDQMNEMARDEQRWNFEAQKKALQVAQEKLGLRSSQIDLKAKQGRYQKYGPEMEAADTTFRRMEQIRDYMSTLPEDSERRAVLQNELNRLQSLQEFNVQKKRQEGSLDPTEDTPEYYLKQATRTLDIPEGDLYRKNAQGQFVHTKEADAFLQGVQKLRHQYPQASEEQILSAAAQQTGMRTRLQKLKAEREKINEKLQEEHGSTDPEEIGFMGTPDKVQKKVQRRKELDKQIDTLERQRRIEEQRQTGRGNIQEPRTRQGAPDRGLDVREGYDLSDPMSTELERRVSAREGHHLSVAVHDEDEKGKTKAKNKASRTLAEGTPAETSSTRGTKAEGEVPDYLKASEAKSNQALDEHLRATDNEIDQGREEHIEKAQEYQGESTLAKYGLLPAVKDTIKSGFKGGVGLLDKLSEPTGHVIRTLWQLPGAMQQEAVRELYNLAPENKRMTQQEFSNKIWRKVEEDKKQAQKEAQERMEEKREILDVDRGRGSYGDIGEAMQIEP